MLGEGLEGEERVGDVVDSGVPEGSASHAGAEVDGEDGGVGGDGEGVGADAAAEVDGERGGGEPGGLVEGDGLGGGLFEAGGVEPHLGSSGEFGLSPALGGGEAEGGGDDLGGVVLSPAGEVGGAGVGGLRDVDEEGAAGVGGEDEEFGVDGEHGCKVGSWRECGMR